MTSSTASVQLARWHQVRARIAAGQPPDPADAVWLGQVVKAIVEDGVPPRVAMELPSRGGAGALHRVAMLARRDVLLRVIHRDYFQGLAPRAAARSIVALADQQQRASRLPHDACGCLMVELLTFGQLPSPRQIANILR